MSAAKELPAHDAFTVTLPMSSTRRQWGHAHLKLLSAVKPRGHPSSAFEGRVLKPGATLTAAELGPNPVVLECVGPVGEYVRGRRMSREWILWRYDWHTHTWEELVRAASVGFEWFWSLRDVAIDAMDHQPELVELKARKKQLIEQIMSRIDELLEGVQNPIALDVLADVYDQVAGRIANRE